MVVKIKKDGIIMVIAPRKESNFDHKREIVKFEHILDDFNSEIAETDLTHLDEILSLHDLKMDPPAGSCEQFKMRSLDNFNNRCLHHHVFDLEILRKIFKYFKLEIIYEEKIYSDYIVIGKNEIGHTAHNRTVYASPPVGGSGFRSPRSFRCASLPRLTTPTVCRPWKCSAFPYPGRQNVVNSRNVM
jgi:hypothetical protein